MMELFRVKEIVKSLMIKKNNLKINKKDSELLIELEFLLKRNINAKIDSNIIEMDIVFIDETIQKVIKKNQGNYYGCPLSVL